MTKPISPLRQRMIDDMTMRNLSPSTHETYIRAVAQFSAFHRQSPDKLRLEHLREYHLHLVSRGLTANSICVKMGALRFFYATTLRRPDIAGQIPMPRRTDHLPTVLAREEVEHLLKAVPDLKQRTALITIYSAGLRVSEAVALTARDIDSARMVIYVRQGKGRKDRYTMLSDQLLGILRDYWHRTRPSHWLFPGLKPSRPMTKRTLQLACRRAAEAAGLEQIGHRPHVAAQLCDPSPRTGCRHSRDPGLARASAHQVDRALCAGCDQHDPADSEPARVPEHGDDSAGLMRRRCPIQSSKWRMFSAATVPLGVLPTKLI